MTERLNADCENDANPCPTAWPDQVELWCVGCLLNRLAALEHERDEEERNHDDTYQKLIKAMFIVRKRAEHAEAALLSLQTALQEFVMYARETAARWQGDNDSYQRGLGSAYAAVATQLAALLPDTAGTIRTNEDDASARVDRRG